MKNKIILILSVVVLIGLFMLSVSAASYTPNFGEVTKVDGMSDKTTFGDDGKFDTFTSRVLMSDGKTYPAYYIYTDSATHGVNFSELNAATGQSYDRNTVICLEIPEGITTIPNCYSASGSAIFWGDKYTPTIEYLKFSSTITSMSTDATIYSIKSLVCLDMSLSKVETIPSRGIQSASNLSEIYFPATLITLGDEALKGCSSLTAVDFSSTQLESMGYRSMFECTGLEKVITGSKIKKIETQSFYKAGTKSSKDYVEFYISDTLEELYCEFGTIWQDAKRTVFYYTGSGDDEILTSIKSNSSVGTNPFLDASGEDFDKNATYEKSTIIYNYNKCDAFFGGVHDTSAITLNFTDFTSAMQEVSNCSRNCGLKTVVVNEYAPIFSGYKFSVKEEGYALCVSYSINNESIKIYNKYSDGNALSCGAVASKGLNDGETLLSLDNGNVIKDKENAVMVNFDTEYAGFDFVLRGFDESHENVKLIINAYVSDGKNIYYISSKTNDEPVEITMAEVKSLSSNLS